MLLGFKRRFAPFVEDGSKTHTIRARRKITPKVGEICHCYVDPRQKTMRLLGRFPCIAVDWIRLFETSFSIPLRPQCQHGGVETLSVTGSGLDSNRDRWAARSSKRRAISITGATPQINVERNRVRKTFSVRDARSAMGIDWMPMKWLSQAIPPAYAQFIGEQAISHIQRRAA